MVSTRGAALWVVAAVGYLVLEAIAAAGFEPAYNYARDYISDLGLPSGRLVRGRTVYSSRAYLIHAAFYLQGILFLLGASLIVGVPDNRRARVFLGTVAGNAVGNIVIGTVHSGTVHIDGEPTRSCITKLASVAGKHVTTIEGLSAHSDHPLQKAWVAEQVPQCGYCQSGQIMEAAALLKKTPKPTREEIVEHMNGHICRCGTYHGIIRAIERAAHEMPRQAAEATPVVDQTASARR